MTPGVKKGGSSLIASWFEFRSLAITWPPRLRDYVVRNPELKLQGNWADTVDVGPSSTWNHLVEC